MRKTLSAGGARPASAVVPAVRSDLPPTAIYGGATAPDLHRLPSGGLLPILARPAPTLGQVTSLHRDDRCPGVLRMHHAADGYVARIRIPGGRLDAAAWTALAAIARDGDGHLHLTSRGNLQVRGLAADAGPVVAGQLDAVGLGPSASHDRVRNLLASPLAGRVAGRFSFGTAIADTLAAVLARPELSDTALSGKFLFGLDDGSGDILQHAPDLGGIWRSDAVTELIIGGTASGIVCPAAELPEVLASLAVTFLAGGAATWRITGNPAARDALHAAAQDMCAGMELLPAPTTITATITATGPHRALAPEPVAQPLVGWIEQTDGRVTLNAVCELARIDARLAEFLGAIECPTSISPERVIGIHDLRDTQAEQVVRVLAPMGLIFDATSPWVYCTACIGAPGCARSCAPVQQDLSAAIAAQSVRREPQHWVGCDRACGWNQRDLLVTATADRYLDHHPDRGISTAAHTEN